MLGLLLTGGGRVFVAPLDQQRPTVVWLASPIILRPPTPQRQLTRSKPQPPSSRKPTVAAPVAPGPSAPSSVTSASGPSMAPPSPNGAGLAASLRRWVGCAHPDAAWMSDADRAACAARFAANRPTAPMPINLDPHGRYLSDPEPYLTRMPKNGCKVRAAGDAGPMGQQGVAAGISCGFSF